MLGGIDRSKYRDTLQSINMYYISEIQDGSFDTSFQYGAYLQLSSLTAQSPTGEDNLLQIPILVHLQLDPGYPSVFPQDLAEVIWDIAGAEYITDLNFPAAPCSMLNSVGNFTFHLGGATGIELPIPMNMLVRSNDPVPRLDRTNDAGEELCMFHIWNSTIPPTYQLSTHLLRLMYMVADPTNGKFAMAPSLAGDEIEGGEENANIIPFPSPSAAIPSAEILPDEGDASFVTAVPVSYTPVAATRPTTYAAAEGFIQTSAPDGDGDTDHRGSDSGLSQDATVGVAVGVSLGVTAVLVVLGVWWLRRRRREKVTTSVAETKGQTPDKTPSSSASPMSHEMASAGQEAPQMLSHVFPHTSEVEGERLPPLQHPGEMPVDETRAGYMNPAELPGDATR